MTEMPSSERAKALLGDWFASVRYDEQVDWREAVVDDDGAVVAALRPRDGDGDGFVYDNTPRMRPFNPLTDLVDPMARRAPARQTQRREGSPSAWGDARPDTAEWESAFNVDLPRGVVAEANQTRPVYSQEPWDGVSERSERVLLGLDVVGSLSYEGEQIGYFERRVDVRARQVRFVELYLEPEWQGEGIGSAFYAASIDNLRALGVEQINVTATSSPGRLNGAYTWARAGFDWQPGSESHRRIARDIRAFADSGKYSAYKYDLFGNIRGVDHGESEALLVEYYDMADRLEALDYIPLDSPLPDDFPTPNDVAMLGWSPGKDKWLGRDVLVTQRVGWEGVLRLDPIVEPDPVSVRRPWGDQMAKAGTAAPGQSLDDLYESVLRDVDVTSADWRSYRAWDSVNQQERLWELFTDPKHRGANPREFANAIALLDLSDISVGVEPLGTRRFTEGPLRERLDKVLPDRLRASLDEFAQRVDAALAEPGVDRFKLSPWEQAMIQPSFVPSFAKPESGWWFDAPWVPDGSTLPDVDGLRAALGPDGTRDELSKVVPPSFPLAVTHAAIALDRGLTATEIERLRVAADDNRLADNAAILRASGRVPAGPVTLDTNRARAEADDEVWGFRGRAAAEEALMPLADSAAAEHAAHALASYELVRNEERLAPLIATHGDPVFIHWGNVAIDGATAFSVPGTSIIGWRRDRAEEDWDKTITSSADTARFLAMKSNDALELARLIGDAKVPISKDVIVDARERLGLSFAEIDNPTITQWRFNAGDGSPAATMRHEYGHVVDSQLRDIRVQERATFFAYLEANPDVRREVSTYATFNDDETFAEFFTVWSHPRFADRYGYSPEAERAFELFEAIVAPLGGVGSAAV